MTHPTTNAIPEKCPRCGGGVGIYDEGRAWACDRCDYSNDVYKQLNEVAAKAAESQPTGGTKLLLDEMNRVLADAGCNIRIEHDARDWRRALWVIARQDLGLSNEDFSALDFYSFVESLKRRNRRDQSDRQNALLQGRFTPPPPVRKDEPDPEPETQQARNFTSGLKRLIQAGLMVIKDRYSNDELRRWMKDNADDDDLQDLMASKGEKNRRRITKTISEVRNALKIPAKN